MSDTSPGHPPGLPEISDTSPGHPADMLEISDTLPEHPADLREISGTFPGHPPDLSEISGTSPEHPPDLSEISSSLPPCILPSFLAMPHSSSSAGGLTPATRTPMFRPPVSGLFPIMIFKSLCRHAGIGANSYLIKTKTAKVVLDDGMHPKHEGSEAIPHYEYLKPGTVDSIIITHSHLDHVGTLPVFLQGQSQAKVFLSPETAELASAMLHNSVNVMQSKRIEHGIAEYPLFEHRELDDI